VNGAIIPVDSAGWRVEHETLEALCAHRVIPSFRRRKRRHTRTRQRTEDGGLPVLEMTLRSENALELLRALAGDVDLLVGRGP